MFNTLGAIIFFIFLIIWQGITGGAFMDATFKVWFSEGATQIAMFHTFFNVLFTLLFCPFIALFVKLAKLAIPDKKEDVQESYIDDRFLTTPSVAVMQVTKEVARMGRLAIETFNESVDAFVTHNKEKTPEIHEKIKLIDKINENIVAYLVKISTHSGVDKDEQFLALLHNSVNDLYRSVEIADNMTKYTRHLVDDQLVFSSVVFEQIVLFKDKINAQYANIELVLLERRYDLIQDIYNL